MTQMPAPPGGGYYPPPPQGRPTNTLAIVALVCAFVFAPAGLVCGILARKQIKQTGEQGDGMALAGIVISAAQMAIGILAIIFIIIAAVMAVEAVDNLPSPSPFPTS